MGLPLVPIAIFGLAGGAYCANRKRTAAIDPVARATYDKIFSDALNSGLSAEKYRELSKVFLDRGLKAQGEMLEKRARLAEAPPELKKARKAAFKAAMSSTNVPGIRAVADAHELMGAQAAADKLREYAAGVEQAQWSIANAAEESHE